MRTREYTDLRNIRDSIEREPGKLQGELRIVFALPKGKLYWGMIIPAQGGKEVFVFKSELKRSGVPVGGDLKVRYDIETFGGKESAVNISIVPKEETEPKQKTA